MTDTKKKIEGLNKEEVSVMKEYLKEKNLKVNGEEAVRIAIAKMKEPSRSMAKRIHAIVKASAPDLSPRTWYGMPAYSKGDKVVCFFQDADKFKARYSMFGFTDKANLDEGKMWPIGFALTKLTREEETRIAVLVKKAMS